MPNEQQHNDAHNHRDEDNRSIMIFYHIVMALLYGVIGIGIGAFLF